MLKSVNLIFLKVGYQTGEVFHTVQTGVLVILSAFLSTDGNLSAAQRIENCQIPGADSGCLLLA